MDAPVSDKPKDKDGGRLGEEKRGEITWGLVMVA